MNINSDQFARYMRSSATGCILESRLGVYFLNTIINQIKSPFYFWAQADLEITPC